MQRIPILVYHHVYNDKNPELALQSNRKASGVISEKEFRRHMDHIAENGWSVISTTQLIDWVDGELEVPRRAVVLHFDNGWLDVRTLVKPILDEYDFTATSYVISDPTGAASQGLPAGIRTSTEGFVRKPFVTWEHCHELIDAGWEIGAHTASHPKLGEVYAENGEDALLDEVVIPNDAYQKYLGFVPKHFAYPSGSRSQQTDDILGRYYRSLRRWTFDQPPAWSFTSRDTPRTAIECQNVDNTVGYGDFLRIFSEAEAED